MTVGFMITNGGPHSPEKWAEMTTSQIIQVGQHPVGRKLELRILEIVEDAHRKVQTEERAALAANGLDGMLAPLDPTEIVDATLALIVAAASETEFSEHFQKADIQRYVRNVLGQHLATSIHIERSWLADTAPDSDQARAFYAARDAA